MSSPNDDVTGLPHTFDKNDFLKEFYKECGREVTLAYTTLNQMKNWAIVVTAAIGAAVASILKASPNATEFDNAKLIFVGSMLAYLFTVRFFVRAIICYVNLLRWNRLQSDILRMKLECDSKCTRSTTELEGEIKTSIDLYYHRWLSTIGRWDQITSNLKLGFGLLLVLPVVVMVWSGFISWESCYTRTATLFVVGGTIIEIYEFMTTGFLDTPEAREKRKSFSRHSFPGPSGNNTTFLLWTGLLLASMFFILYCTGALCPR